MPYPVSKLAVSMIANIYIYLFILEVAISKFGTKVGEAEEAAVFYAL